ncbi:wax ester/triacylglycerol synthase domain-containing protein [Rhodococcus sp. NPDC004095]
MTSFRRQPAPARLAPQDAEYYYNEFERHRSNVVAIYLFESTSDTAVGTAEVTAWMRERLGQARMFTHRIRRVPLDLDLPRWERDPGVDASRHVTVEPIDGPGWEPLRRRISHIVGSPLDLTRPPWELHVITGITDIDDSPGRMTAVVLKFHHSAGDGIATRDLGLRLFGPAPEATRPPTPAGTGSGSDVTEFARAAATLPGQLVRFGRGLGDTRAAARRVRELSAAGEIVEPLASRPACRFNGRITPDPTFDHVRLPRRAIDAVRAETPGATVNDVLLATVSGALAGYLAEVGESPAGSLAAMVPMSLRGTAAGAGADTDGPRATHLALMSVDLHTGTADPLTRLHAIMTSARNEKARHGNEHVRRASRRIESSPAWLLSLAGHARRIAPSSGATVALHNTMVSNVPWAGTDLTFLGEPLVRILGVLGVVDGSGLRHLAVTSDPGAVDLTFTTDTAMMADTRPYKRLLTTSLNDLVRASIV